MKRATLSLVLAALAAGPALAEDLTVSKDQSKVIKLTNAAATIVVGNPNIADVAMQDGTTAFITGRGFGTTNVIAMDAEGRQIASFRVVVAADANRSVTLVRGGQIVTLSCAPRCEAVASAGEEARQGTFIVHQHEALRELWETGFRFEVGGEGLGDVRPGRGGCTTNGSFVVQASACPLGDAPRAG